MKAKTFSLMIASLFLLVLMTSFSSAALVLSTPVYESTVLHNAGHFDVSFTLTNTGLSTANLTWTGSVTGADATLDLSALPAIISANNSISLSVPVSFAPYKTGNIQGTINVNSQPIPFTVSINQTKGMSVSNAQLSGDSTTINVKNIGNTLLTGVVLSASTGNFEINFSQNNFNLNAGENKSIIVSLVNENSDSVGESTITITATSGTTSATGTIKRNSNFCNGVSSLENLEIRNINLNNKGMSGTINFGKDGKWYPFEEIEVTVEVENRGNNNIRDISLEWGLYNTNLKQWVIDVNEEDNFDLDQDDNLDVIFSFVLDDSLDIDLQDLTNGEDYVLYIRATGKFDEGANEGKETCVSDSENAEIILEKDFVILDNLDSEYSASCGSSLSISGDAWNIGTRDQKDIIVVIKNSDLKINKELTIDDLNSFDNQAISFTIDVPENAKEGSYWLELEVYDEDGDIYVNDDDKEAVFPVKLTIQGSCNVESNLDILADAGEVTAGKEASIKVVITNLGSITQTFDLSLTSYSSWAENAQIVPDYLVIRGGESKEIEITLQTKDDSTGTNVLNLILTSENGVETQPIEVEVLQNKGFLGISGFVTGGNTYTTGLTLLIIVLIIIILITLFIKKIRK